MDRRLAVECVVSEMLADCEVDALDVAGTWRLIAREAIHALARKHVRITHQNEIIQALREELRARMGLPTRSRHED